MHGWEILNSAFVKFGSKTNITSSDRFTSSFSQTGKIKKFIITLSVAFLMLLACGFCLFTCLVG